jgi:hypothetical protein
MKERALIRAGPPSPQQEDLMRPAPLRAVALAGLAAAALVLPACGRPVDSVATGAGPGGGPGLAEDPSTAGRSGPIDGADLAARLDEQAGQALRRWDAAVAASGAAALRFVPVDAGTGMAGEWEPQLAERGKLALTAGLFEAAPGALDATAPAPGEVRWADGATLTVPLLPAGDAVRAMRSDGAGCGGCAASPLLITGARLVTVTVATHRGGATVPAWEFTVDGSAARVTRVAVSPEATVTVTPPPWDPFDAPAGLAPQSATTGRDGSTVTLHFTGSADGDGPCSATYTARAVESDTAAVVIIDEHHAAGSTGDQVCPALGHPRTAELTLRRPLGDRTLLEVTQGRPVRVLP